MTADITGNKVEGVSDNDRKSNNPSLLKNKKKIRTRKKKYKKRKNKNTIETQNPIPHDYKTLRLEADYLQLSELFKFCRLRQI